MRTFIYMFITYIYICVCVCVCVYVCVFVCVCLPNSFTTSREILKWNTAGLNSEFSFF